MRCVMLMPAAHRQGSTQNTRRVQRGDNARERGRTATQHTHRQTALTMTLSPRRLAVGPLSVDQAAQRQPLPLLLDLRHAAHSHSHSQSGHCCRSARLEANRNRTAAQPPPSAHPPPSSASMRSTRPVAQAALLAACAILLLAATLTQAAFMSPTGNNISQCGPQSGCGTALVGVGQPDALRPERR